MKLQQLNLPAPPEFQMSTGASTLANPSPEFMQSLIGFPTAAGKPVTRANAIRIASFLAAVKILSQDIAKMPLILKETSLVDGRQRIQPALKNPLYALLKFVPNGWQTSYQLRCFLASQLIMAGNCFCQIIEDGKGQILKLNPLNAWSMAQKWNYEAVGGPQPYWQYSDGLGNLRKFYPRGANNGIDEVFHVANNNYEANGMEGMSMIALAKECLSVLMAAEETAGRNFANGLGMGGFLTLPPAPAGTSGVKITEPQAQDMVDRLKKDFSGSQNAGKFTYLPGGMKWEKMTFNAQESQLLESRKWNVEEIVRVLGGAPLLVKLGLGGTISTYGSSVAFLDDYFNTSLLPYCVAIEQSISRDLIDPKDRATLFAKHDQWVITRGSHKDRAEYYKDRVTNGSMSPNMVAVLEEEDTIEGFGDYRFFPANSAYFDPETGMAAIPGQSEPAPDPAEASESDDDADESDGPEAGATPDLKKLQNRLLALATASAERVERKFAKAGTVEPQFIADNMNVPLDTAIAFCAKGLTKETLKDALIALATQGE